MKTDLNKGINYIKYNHLNLPTEITFSDNNKIKYIYNSSGQKISKTVHHNSDKITTEYLDGFQYIDEDLQFFPTSEGYVRKTDGTNRRWFDYVYNYTDHLGNIRLSYTTDPISGSANNIKILEENNYYPFGLQHGSYNTPARDYRPIGEERDVLMVNHNPYQYKYNGKEWQEELGLDWYDYGARMYMPDIGRWSVHDPASEMTLDPYGYVYNNPIQLVDENGEFPILSGIAGFFKGMFSSRRSYESGAKTRMDNALRTAGRYEKQAWQIVGGLGTTDKNKSFGGQALQLLSRFTWELPNTVAGFITAESTNVVANVNWVDYEAGATVLNTGYYFGAFTLGSFIVGDADIQADREDKIFKHEYGHYLQSQTYGPGYLFGFALPSVVRAGLWNMDVVGGKYDDFYTERNATKRGNNYFKKSEAEQRNTTSFFNIDREQPCFGCYDDPPDWLKKDNTWSNE